MRLLYACAQTKLFSNFKRSKLCPMSTFGLGLDVIKNGRLTISAKLRTPRASSLNSSSSRGRETLPLP